ncbi:PRC-barrel domain-containing protein [Psychromarinibacter sp. C21-152]|uniref:PRC-barrel domain-containing protein n=1 Tax=Psychromarinibacter sediminicola TaxID=3033385 RepID=A0AAE3T9H1_9RHOB|nr:PRC-barrel domain-containing protein [Psychromarinibacter sediminicola]MDF0602197.1 PRC-barrel domain-containing protein [Psychromarinibacter sediminicola]
MKTVIASTLALTIGAAGAFAASHETDGDMAGEMAGNAETMDLYSMDQAEMIRTRDITGGEVYTMNEAEDEGSAWDVDTVYEEVGADWNEIGEIEDLILSRDGQLIGIVAEVGGFLDIADKHVMINIEDVKLVPVDNRDYVYVTRHSEEELEAMEGVDEGFWN